MTISFYHTQEDRGEKLFEPVLCVKNNAWLGDAYYFWENEQDAHFWGLNFKRRTGSYDIYKSEIDMDNV
jgi:hypothetical protein